MVTFTCLHFTYSSFADLITSFISFNYLNIWQVTLKQNRCESPWIRHTWDLLYFNIKKFSFRSLSGGICQRNNLVVAADCPGLISGVS